jgi:hypothetical protein
MSGINPERTSSAPSAAPKPAPAGIEIKFLCPQCGHWTSAALPALTYDDEEQITSEASVYCSNDDCMQEYKFTVA